MTVAVLPNLFGVTVEISVACISHNTSASTGRLYLNPDRFIDHAYFAKL